MAKVVQNNLTSPGGEIQKRSSKVVDYNLEEFVIDLYTKGYTESKIADECNKSLAAREGNQVYIEINHMNVRNYLAKAKKGVERTDLANILTQKMPDVAEKLNYLFGVLQDELEKLRKTSGEAVNDSKQDLFIKMLKEVKSLIQLSANIQGMVPPQTVAVNIINNMSPGITKLTEKINNSDLSQEAKEELFSVINNEILDEKLLKMVEGKVVKESENEG